MSDAAGEGDPTAIEAPGSRIVLFDFDGVLIRGDSFAAFVRARYRQSPWRLFLAVPLALAASPLALFRRGRWQIVRLLVRVGLLGVDETRYRSLAAAFARAHAERPRIFLREGISTLRRHLAAGDRVVVVTGCEQQVARGLFDAIGLDGFELVASRLERGWLGLRPGVHCFGARKPRELAAGGIEPPWTVAYTDSAADAPMLREAADAVLVNGTPTTCRALERALGRSVRRVEWT